LKRLFQETVFSKYPNTYVKNQFFNRKFCYGNGYIEADMDDVLDEKTYETRKVEYASLLPRTASVLADVLIFIATSYGIFYLLKPASDYSRFMEMVWWKLLIAFLVYRFYFAGSESNATPGMQIMNIRFLTEQQRDISFTDALKHLLLSVLLFFGYPLLVSNEKKQTLADKMCKVIVVKVR